MNTLRRFTNFAAIGLGALLFVSSASATTITQTTTVFGNIPSLTAPASGSTSAAQFNATTTNTAIQSACAAGHTCSALTLIEIDFAITANLSASVTVANSTGTTQFINSISGSGGVFGAPTSGFAVAEVATVTLGDGITSGLAVAVPTFSVATNVERKKACAGTPATSGNFANCLSIGTAGASFSGTGTDMGSGSYMTSDSTLTGAVSTEYVGAGSVSFSLDIAGATNNGTLPAGVTIPTNTAALTALTNGLEVDYIYTYTDTITSSAPEPSTMLLFGGALLGAGLLRRRRAN